MSFKKLLIYLAICMVSLTLLGYQMLHRGQTKVPVAINLNPPSETAIPFVAELEQKNALDIDGYSVWYLEEKLRAQPVMTGREDPFARLPQEKAVLESATPITPETTNVEVPLLPEASLMVRGILVGRESFAFIEAEDGLLRKVKVGDGINGGVIVSITSNTVTIRYGENLVLKKLGE